MRALQNIGGIANVAAIGEKLEEVLAFDKHGPGYVMIDALARLASGGADTMDPRTATCALVRRRGACSAIFWPSC